MRLIPRFQIVCIFASFMTMHTIEFSAHCMCKKLHTIVREGESLTSYKYAWFTLLHSQEISLEEKRELVPQTLTVAQSQRDIYAAQLQSEKKKPHYQSKVTAFAALGLSSYLLSSLAVFVARRGAIKLYSTQTNPFFYLPQRIYKQKQRGFDMLGMLLAGIQVAVSATLAPYGLYWGYRELSAGPAKIRALEEKIANLTEVIDYIATITL